MVGCKEFQMVLRYGVTDVIYMMETETEKKHSKRVLHSRNELDSKIFLSMETFK